MLLYIFGMNVPGNDQPVLPAFPDGVVDELRRSPLEMKKVILEENSEEKEVVHDKKRKRGNESLDGENVLKSLALHKLSQLIL